GSLELAPNYCLVELFKPGFIDPALPDRKDTPAESPEFSGVATVTLLVASDLRPPIIRSTLRQPAPSASVSVPEAPMHEYNHPARREHEIGLTGKLSIVQPIAKASPVQVRAHDHLGLSVACSYQRHPVAAGLGVEKVHAPSCRRSANIGAAL